MHYAQLPLLAALVAMVGLGLTLSSLIDRRILPAQISPAE
jgi:DHA1 family inner membrane transport protein